MWSSPRKVGEIGKNTGKRWRNTRKTWRAEILSCNGEKAVAHVAAEEFHPPALFRRELAEVLSDSAAGDLIRNIDHRVGIPVGDAAVILAEAPFVCFGAPDAAVSLEFIDADGFRKFFRNQENVELS